MRGRPDVAGVVPVGLGVSVGRSDGAVVGDLDVEALAPGQGGLVGPLGLRRLGAYARLNVVRRLRGGGHGVLEGYVYHATVLLVFAVEVVVVGVTVGASAHRGGGGVLLLLLLLLPGGRGGGSVNFSRQGLAAGAVVVLVVRLVGEPARRLAETTE